MKMPVGYVKSG